MDKITDEEIIKAFEVCYMDRDEDCSECPLNDEDMECTAVADNNLLNEVFELINRQKAEIDILKAEIERLQKENHQFADIGKFYSEIKSDVVKEFAERLKKKTYPFPCAIGVENAVTIRAINDLVKEMTEEQ